ncbi:hypothetical protein HPL01_001833 [Salmonella enterica]|nr:hypothetical protein [Salmonella enterica]
MGNNIETKDTNNMIAKSDEGQKATFEGKMRVYMSFQPIVLPHIGELINEMILRGRSAEEIQAAVGSAALGYSTFYQTFMNPQELTGHHSHENQHQQDAYMSENTTQTAPKDGPHIDAGDMSPQELRDWLRGMAKSAGSMDTFDRRATDSVFESLKDRARELADDLTEKVNFLQCKEISRSADHTSAIQGDLRHYQGMLLSVRGFLQAAEPYRIQNAEIHQTSSCLTHECGAQECKGSATQGSD